MAYKILYMEDANPDSHIADLEKQGFNVSHHDPERLEDALTEISNVKPDLILLDFKLEKARYNAPTIAQTVRTDHCNIPIVLISSETNIAAYYADYTSQDLFDFATTKNNFSENIVKYSNRINNLISGYRLIAEATSLLSLFAVPQSIKDTLDSRLINQLENQKSKNDTFIASTFIVNNIVKPIGILIGEDVVSARLGIDKTSEDWPKLIQLLSDFRYSGIYGESYQRWWSTGLDLWWKSNFPEQSQLRRLTASERKSLLQNKFQLSNLTALIPSECSKGTQFWTICTEKYIALDPIDGFQLEDSNLRWPWLETEYVSFSAVKESNTLLKRLTVFARNRFKDIAKAV